MKPPINSRLALCCLALFLVIATGVFFLPVGIEYRMGLGFCFSALAFPAGSDSPLYALLWKLDRKWHRRSSKPEHIRTGWDDARLRLTWSGDNVYMLPDDAANPDRYLVQVGKNGIDGLVMPESNDTPEKRLAYFLNAHSVGPYDTDPPMRPCIIVRRVGVLSGLPVQEVDILRNSKRPQRLVNVTTFPFHTA